MKPEGLHFFITEVNKWRHNYHTDHAGTVIFQNKETLTNVRFTNKSMHVIQGHSKGVEQLPDTIIHPEEIWSWWKDAKDQKDVCRAYIKGNYVVLTEAGQITDSFLVRSADKYRRGCLITL